MYRKLLPLLKRFVFVRQGAFNRYYEGKLVAVDEDSLQIQSYKKDGSPEELWTISLETISEFSVGGRHLAELELKVSFLFSEDMLADNDLAILMLEGPSLPVVETSADEIAE
ncbi:hypothetical protein [Vampirovibrio sp.]|uniref:hypothetical protein n=1 Tax=Vampirovibrio sp. TaxID=2717857 RepID=UPI003593859D